MRILVLTQWYPPEPQKLLSELTTTLQGLGHEVTVLTGFPNWPSGQLYPGYRLKLQQKELLDGIPITRVPLYPNHSSSALKRILNFVSFAVSATLLGPWLMRRTDVIHVIHPPVTVALPAWLLSRLWHVPFTYEIQDMWPETLQATGMLNNRRALAAVAQFARWVYRRAALIRVISPGFRDNLISKGVPPDKIQVISNWVDIDFYRPVEPDLALAQQVGLASRFNIMYAGTIGLAQGLESILDAAGLVQELPEIQFVFVGDGIDLPRLKSLADERRLTNVKFLGRYPVEAMPALYAWANALLIHLRDDPLFRITIPHKTFTYLASGRPILAAVEGDVATIVKSAGAGLTCPPSDPPALADIVRQLYSMTADERAVLGQNGRQIACEQYSREYLVGQIAQMLTTAVARSGSDSRGAASRAPAV
jgi:colanic acid biosynthesis glycosyl transferase WcaI